MLSKGKWILAGLLVIVLLALSVGSVVTWAQGPTPTPPKTWMDLYRQSLAQKLGTTVEKLQQATVDARKDALDQAVKQGLLTQAQADRLSQRARGGAALASIATARLDATAKALGMSTGDLTAALRGGKTLLDLAREKKVDATKLRTAIADAEKAALDQAVKDGKLPQAQADALKAKIKPENIDLNRRGMGAPRGMGRGPVQQFGGRGPAQQFRGRGPAQGFMGRFGNRFNNLPQNRMPRNAPPPMPQFWR